MTGDSGFDPRLSGLALLLTLTLATPQVVWPCGNHTHIGVTLHAIEHLPAGALKTLVTKPELRQMLVNGTIFPDGGYASGHDYGETAHWEPYQRALAEVVTGACPKLPEGCEPQLAFLLGMASHGLADQVFDGLFMEVAKRQDAEGWSGDLFSSLDTMSDIIWAAEQGAAESPGLWLPMPELLAAFQQRGVEVTADKIQDGQTLLLSGVLTYVRNNATNADKVAEAKSRYPWSAAHLRDPHTPGSPFCIGRMVAAYWQHLWDEWTGGTPAVVAFATVPSDGGAIPSGGADDPRSFLAVVFSRGLAAAETRSDRVRVTDAAGQTVPTTVDVFYNDNGQMLRIKPETSWPQGTLKVNVQAGAVTGRVGSLPSAEVVFRARVDGPKTVEPGAPPAAWPLAAPSPATDDGGCGASRRAVAGHGLVWLLLALVWLWRYKAAWTTRSRP